MSFDQKQNIKQLYVNINSDTLTTVTGNLFVMKRYLSLVQVGVNMYKIMFFFLPSLMLQLQCSFISLSKIFHVNFHLSQTHNSISCCVLSTYILQIISIKKQYFIDNLWGQIQFLSLIHSFNFKFRSKLLFSFYVFYRSVKLKKLFIKNILMSKSIKDRTILIINI